MAVTATASVRTIVQDALQKIQVVTLGQTPDATESELARRTLARMLKAWQMEGHPVFLTALQSLTLTTAASYTLNPVRPLRILGARLKRDGIETPMEELTRREYDELPDKTVTGLPTTFHYDRQREAALFYVWPVLATADGETVQITYEREIDDHASLNDTLDAPVEWHHGIVYALADDLQPDFGKNDMRVTAKAAAFRASILGASAEESVFFEPSGHG